MTSAIIFYLLLVHIASAAFSIYVHRGIGHHYFEFSKPLEHIFRFILWFIVGLSWPNWQKHYAAKHRKHHKHSDTYQDPHSPHYYSLAKLFDFKHNSPGRANYISMKEIEQYAPDIVSSTDTIQRKVYNRYPWLGQVLFWVLLTYLFGGWGFVIGAFNCFLLAYMFLLIGNYSFHKVGFKYAGNLGSDRSRILFPWGLFSAGEELHANHHNDTSNPNFRRRWFEIDLGWVYSKILIKLGLMRLRNSAGS